MNKNKVRSVEKDEIKGNKNKILKLGPQKTETVWCNLDELATL